MTSRETEIIVAKLEERDDARREQIEELKALVKEGFERTAKQSEELDERLTSVEGELKFIKRVGTPVVSAITIAFTTWLNSVLKGQ